MCLNLFDPFFLVTPCLVVAVQPCMERIPKKEAMNCVYTMHLTVICVAADHRASDFLFSSCISYLYNFTILFPTHLYKKCLFQKNPYHVVKQRPIDLFVKLLFLFVCKVQS